jgi:tripartite-type tricarboxylate transporter receptor subunit TctC
MKKLFLTFGAALLTTTAIAQTYPSKPISFVVGYSPGGSTDLAARSVAPELAKRLGASIVIDNVAGAGGALGTQKVVSAPADGYTLLLGTSAEIAVAKLVSPTVKYDGLVDVVPVGMIGTQPMVIVTTPAVPANTTAELLDLLRKNPGKYSYGSAGNASLPHLGGELFKSRSKTDIVHVPYKGAGPMITDLLGNQLPMGVLLFSSALPQVKAGKLKAIAITEPTRDEQLPNVPALAEHRDLAGFDLTVFFGVFMKAGTPKEI